MHTNRLIHETSPYLLQHAHNPVDWYAWGREAFDAARAQDKPIFLSVGYSTCYWCHVMERQCFENEPIAKLMNELFINIKVDREERPDVDQLYMDAVQVLTRHGGWPMSVFLMPDLRPFYGGTYFPPEDAHGRPGFPTVLRSIYAAYRDRRSAVVSSAEQLVSILQHLAAPPASGRAITIDANFIDELVRRSASDYEPRHGGFGSAPKFPRETLLELLLTYCPRAKIQDPKSKIEKMLRYTLDAMANGGIRDHLGGGFHRYSTDARWLVPHFEIMLYDNAMLGWCYTEAHRQFNEPRYGRVARGIFDFVLREMTSPQGACYTAFDAEVDAQEGLSYLWTRDEVNALLKQHDAKLFSRVYGLDRGANFADPHHGSGVPDRNILHLPDGPELEDDPRIVAMREALYTARRQRKQPLLDTKIITSWNALMIRALAFAGRVFEESRYTQAAEAAVRFLLAHHRTSDGGLYRTSRDGRPKYDAFLDDYAFLAQALLELGWNGESDEIAKQMQQRFADPRGGFYFSSESAGDIIIRQMIGFDSPLPSGNAVTGMVMVDLERPQMARDTIARFATHLEAQAEGMSAMVQAAMLHVQRHGPIQVASDAQASQGVVSPRDVAANVVALSAAWQDASTLELRLRVQPEYHLNAHEASEGLIGTEVRVLSDDVSVASIEYPPGVARQLAFAGAPLYMYEGQVSIFIRFSSPPTVGTIRISLQYQPCDESACLPPVAKTLEIPART